MPVLARQSRFQMDDDGDLHEQILHTEAHIEGLTDIMERCRKIILISKAAIAAGGTLILAIIIGAVGRRNDWVAAARVRACARYGVLVVLPVLPVNLGTPLMA